MTRALGRWSAAVLIAASLAACGGANGASVTAEPNSPTVAAKDLAFDRTELDIPAGRAFTLVFENRDGAPHNVAIYRDATATDGLFVGDVVSGPATRVYAIPALPAGTWYFRCDVHPDMHGQVVATSG
jgi:plastocyanin